MATRSRIITEFETKGAGRVAKETEAVGRAQTRLGQASASAGRQFSAQANGLGGVVGVYAAAAANVFAITAAFTALNRAAQFDTIIRGTEQLAQAVGSSASEVVGALKNITDGQLTVVEAATQANLALSAGFNVDQIEQLGEVALKASRALGRNLTDSFQRITRGAIKLEPELLDEIGIFTRIEPAVEAYASSLNKSASQLTQFERRQAFVNQVIKDGQAAFQDIEGEGKSTQETFEALVANFSDLALIVGKFIADSLAPLAEFLDKNLGNRIVLLGAIGTLVFGRLRESISAFAVTGLASISNSLEGYGEKLRSTKLDVDALAKSQQAAAQSFVGGGALAGAGRGEGAQLKRDLAAGPLTTGQAQALQSRIPELIKNEKNERAALRDNIRQGNLEREKGSKLINQSVQRTRALRKTQELVNVQLATSGVLANTFAKGLRAAGVAAGLLGTALNKALGFLNFIVIGFTTLQFLGSFFDIDLFEKVKNALAAIGKETRDVEKGFKSLAKTADEATGSIAILLESAENFSKTQLLSRIGELAEQPVSSLKRLRRIADREIRELERGTTLSQVFGLMDDEESAAAIEERRITLEAINKLLNGQGQKLIEIADASTKVSEAAGLETADIAAKGFNKGLLDIENSILRINGIELGTVQDLTENMAIFGVSLTDAINKANELGKALKDGSTSGTRASKDAITVVSQFEKAIAAAESELANMQGGTPAFFKLEEAIAAAENGLQQFKNTTQEVVNNVVALDNIAKTLQSQGGSSFKFLDESIINGVFSAETGKIARNEQEAATFRAQNLLLLQKQLENAREQGKTGEEIESLEVATGKARKLAQADLIKQVQSLDAVLKKQEQQLEIGRQTLTIKRQEIGLLSMQVTNNALANSEKLALQTQKNTLSLRQKNLEIQKLQADAARDQAAREMEILRAQQERAKLLQDRADIAAGQADATATFKERQELAGLEFKKAAIEARTLTTRDQIIRMEIEILEKKNQFDNARIDREIKAADRDRKNKLADIQRREDLFLTESTFKEAELRAQKELLETEKSIAASQSSLRQAEIAQQIKESERAKAELPLRKSIADSQAKLAFTQRDFNIKELQTRANLLKAQIESNKAYLTTYAQLLREEASIRGKPFGASTSDFESGAANASSMADTQLTNLNALGTQNSQTLALDLSKNTLQNQLENQQIDFKINSLQKQLGLETDIAKKEAEAFDMKIKSVTDDITLQQELRTEKLRNFEEERINAQDVFNAKKQSLEEERILINQEFEAKKDALEAQLSAARTLVDTLRAVRDVMKNEIGTIIDTLFQNIADGKNVLDNFGEVLRNSFENIRKTILQKTLIEPLQEKFVSGFNSFFGFDEKKGINEVVLENGAIPVVVKNSEGDNLFEEATGQVSEVFETMKDKLGDFGSSVGDIFSNLGSSISSIFGSIGSSLGGIAGGIGGGISGAFSGISGIFGSFFGGGAATPIPGPMGLAAGGAVRRFASGGMNRDRVPALLEPGEFVMKRSAARSIGEPALNAMNATGSGGNVSVNIQNNGSPKQAEASQPRFDGEKFVVDIVMRDLASNGPIRRSLRAGGGS